MAALPWFPFYWSEFEAATAHWSCAEVGLYMRLLTHQWNHGFIPDDLGEIQRISREFDTDQFNKCWNKCSNKFPEVSPGKRANQKLSTVIVEQLKVRDKRAAAGRASAEARRQKKIRQQDN